MLINVGIREFNEKWVFINVSQDGQDIYGNSSIFGYIVYETKEYYVVRLLNA